MSTEMKATILAVVQPNPFATQSRDIENDDFNVAKAAVNLCSWREADRHGGSVDYTLVLIEAPGSVTNMQEMNASAGPLVAFTEGLQNNWIGPDVVRATNKGILNGQVVAFKFLTVEAARACQLSLMRSVAKHSTNPRNDQASK